MNIATRLFEVTQATPNKVGLRVPSKNGSYEDLRFEEIEKKASQYAHAFSELGIEKGTKTLLFVRPGLDFPSLTFALFKIGAVPIFIDPGMGRKNLLNAIAQVKPEAMIAVPEVHFARLLFPQAFRTIKTFVTTGSFAWGKMKKLKSFLKEDVPFFPPLEVKKEDLAAILFTSGGTGIPKGVEYTHHIFSTQTDLLQEMFSLTPDDVDIPGFPLFSLFTLTMGMQSCPPDMDASKPAQADPEKLVKNILDHKATFVAGSPAIWSKVAFYCQKKNIQLPSVKYMVMFGAPVSIEIHRAFKEVLPNGTTYTPYGATESLPVSCISGKEVLENTATLTNEGKGTCVGKPVSATQVKIIPITDSPVESFDQTHELPAFEIGEIIVKGPTVTRRYFEMPEKTLEAKIMDGEEFWHRIGDIGYFDDQGQLWFCGRKTHRVQTEQGLLSSVQCEAIFNQHESVKKSALVGLQSGQFQTPGIVLELEQGKTLDSKSKQELLEIASRYKHTKNIQKVFVAKTFPLDVRHNIKIDRLKLRDMAQQGRLS